MERTDHRGLLDSQQFAIFHRIGGAHASWQPREATLAKEIAGIQDSYCRLLTRRGNNSEFYLALLDVEEGITRFALRVNSLFLPNAQNLSALANVGKKLLHVEIAVSGGHNGPGQFTSSVAAGLFDTLQSGGTHLCVKISKMMKRNLRVVKWVGTIPATGVCTFCDRTFSVPLNAMKRVSEAQENLRVQFAEHACKVSGEPEPIAKLS